MVNKRPNLLFIMTDQHRYDIMSIAGNDIIETPNMDRIGQEGVYFERAYSHCPVCGPARTSMLLGKSLEKTGIRTNRATFDYEENDKVCSMETFDDILSKNGYYTEYQGKWHAPECISTSYDNPDRTVFNVHKYNIKIREDVCEKIPPREPEEGEQIVPTYNQPYEMDPIDRRYGLAPGEKPDDGRGDIIQPDNHGKLKIPAEYTKTAYTGRETIEALERSQKNDQPFSITCSFGPPHAPMVIPDPYYSMYPPEDMVLPESIEDSMENSPYKNTNGRQNMPEYRDIEKIKYMMSNYYGMVRQIDDWIGKIIDKLEEMGELDNTLIIYTSDHGEMLGAHGMREKNVFYEESVHVPFVMRFPEKIKPNTVVKEPVSHLDLYPTILDFLGVDEQEADGKSLRPLIEGESKKSGESYTIAEWNYRGDTEPNYCVVTEKWKYIICRTDRVGLIDCLYNLEEDPNEMNNLIGKNPDRESYRERAEIMKSYLLEYMERINHPFFEEVKEKNSISQV